MEKETLEIANYQTNTTSLSVKKFSKVLKVEDLDK